MKTTYNVIPGGVQGLGLVTGNAREAVSYLQRTHGTLYAERGGSRSYPIGADSQLTVAQQLTRVRQARDYLRTLEARRDRGEIE